MGYCFEAGATASMWIETPNLGSKPGAGVAQESGQPVHPVAVVGLLELDGLWYITVGRTRPRVFLFWGCVSGW